VRRPVFFTAMMLAASTYAFAKGAPSPPRVVAAGVFHLPRPHIPKTSVQQVLGGCGGKRIRDPKTHKCVGPGDLQH
jgi:hypothetical protein